MTDKETQESVFAKCIQGQDEPFSSVAIMLASFILAKGKKSTFYASINLPQVSYQTLKLLFRKLTELYEVTQKQSSDGEHP